MEDLPLCVAVPYQFPSTQEQHTALVQCLRRHHQRRHIALDDNGRNADFNEAVLLSKHVWWSRDDRIAVDHTRRIERLTNLREGMAYFDCCAKGIDGKPVSLADDLPELVPRSGAKLEERLNEIEDASEIHTNAVLHEFRKVWIRSGL